MPYDKYTQRKTLRVDNVHTGSSTKSRLWPSGIGLSIG